MKTFKIWVAATNEDFHRHMMGYNGGYVLNTFEVVAEDKEQAKKAMPLVVAVRDVEEDERMRKEAEEAKAKEEARKEARKEWEKAHPEIVAERKLRAKKTRLTREIKEAKEEMERLRKMIERKERQLAEMEG